MTRRTSSPYVGITTSTDGPPPTDPLYATTFEELAASREAEDPTLSDREYVIWMAIGKIKHLFGIHSFVPLEEWDLGAGSMRFIGSVCWHCQERSG